MAQTNTEKRSPRLLKRGDLLQVPDGDYSEPIRGLDVVAHLGNGMDVVLPIDVDVDVILEPDPAQTVASKR